MKTAEASHITRRRDDAPSWLLVEELDYDPADWRTAFDGPFIRELDYDPADWRTAFDDGPIAKESTIKVLEVFSSVAAVVAILVLLIFAHMLWTSALG